MYKKMLSLLIMTCLIAACFALDANAWTSSVIQQKATVLVSKKPGRFDLLTIDARRHRLLAAHSQAGTLAIIDTAKQTLVREVPVGESSGVAIDTMDNKYFVGTSKGVADINRTTLVKTGFVNTSGPADAMAFDPANDRLYVGHDDGKELWVIDAKDDKLLVHIDLPGTPELMEIDPHSNMLYLNIKNRNETVAIDLHANRVVSHWPKTKTDSPHGLALDLQHHRLFVAGHSASVSVFSLPDGKALHTFNIGPGHVDQIAFDSAEERLYCPSSGQLIMVDTHSDSGKVIGSIRIPPGTHSVAVDPDTHWVWIAFANRSGSFVRAFKIASNVSVSPNK